MERMSEVSTAGNVVWDREYYLVSSFCCSSCVDSYGLVPVATSPTLTENSCSPSAVGDSLPPFASLTSDEERERKAEAYSPGTYHVIVNPDSFSGLPEYADDSVEGPSIRDRTGSAANSVVSGSRGEERENSIETDDPNVVILAKFEDSTRRPSSNWRASRPSPRLGATGSSSPAIRPQFPPHDRVQEDSSRSLDQVITRGGQDARLLSHFRDVVWKQLVQVESPPESASTSHFNSPGVEIFEREAATFRPVRLPSPPVQWKERIVLKGSSLAFPRNDGGVRS